jgi:hypothetical protein
VWPTERPRIRCQYGTVTSRSGMEKRRYHEYTLMTDELGGAAVPNTRHLWVVSAAAAAASSSSSSTTAAAATAGAARRGPRKSQGPRVRRAGGRGVALAGRGAERSVAPSSGSAASSRAAPVLARRLEAVPAPPPPGWVDTTERAAAARRAIASAGKRVRAAVTQRLGRGGRLGAATTRLLMADQTWCWPVLLRV